MKIFIRPLTKNMMTSLQLCRQIELDGGQCTPDDLKHCMAALYKRDYVGLKKATVYGKELMVVFVTAAGINCLEYLKSRNDIGG